MAVELNIQSNSRQAQDDIRRLRSSVEGIQVQAQNSVTAFRNLGRAVQFAFAAFAGGVVTSSFTRAADEARRINTQLRLVTQSAEEFAVAQRDINRIAISNRIEAEGLATVYNRLARAGAALGRSQAEVAIATESIARAVQISGASAESANAAIIQLGQGLASGQLRGEELNSVLEQTPRIAQIIADELGVTTGQLRALAAEGQITSDVVFNALVNQSERIATEFAQVETTVQSAFTVFGIGIRSVLVALDDASGLTEGLASRLISVGVYLNDFGRNFDRNIDLIESRFLRLEISARQFVASFANFSLQSTLPDVEELQQRLTELRTFSGDIIIDVIARIPGIARIQEAYDRLRNNIQDILFDVDVENHTAVRDVLNSVIELSQALLAPFVLTIQAVTPDTSGIVEAFNNLRSTLTDILISANIEFPSFSIVREQYDELVASFRDINFTLNGAFGQSVQAIIDFLTSLRDDYFAEINITAPGIDNVLPRVRELFTEVGNFGRRSVEIFIDFAGLDTAYATFTGWVTRIYDAAYGLYMDLVGGSIFPDIVDGIVAEFNRLVSVAAPIYNRFIDGLSNRADQLGELFSELTGEITLPDLPDITLPSVSELQSSLNSVTPSSLMGLTDAIRSAVSEGASSFWDFITDDNERTLFFARFRRGARDAFENFSEGLTAQSFLGLGALIWDGVNIAFDATLIASATAAAGKAIGNAILGNLRRASYLFIADRIGGHVADAINSVDIEEFASNTASAITRYLGRTTEESTGIAQLGGAIGAAFIDAIQGTVSGLLFSGDSFGESATNAFNALVAGGFLAAFVSSRVRRSIFQLISFAFTGLGAAETVGGQRLNLDDAGAQRQLRNRQVYGAVGGFIAAGIAAELAEELGGNDYVQVGAAIAGQIGGSIVTLQAWDTVGSRVAGRISDVVSNISLNLGARISDAADAGLQNLGVSRSLSNRLSGLLFSAVGSPVFWVGLGIVGALGAAIAAAFVLGGNDANLDEVLGEQVRRASEEFSTAATLAGAGLEDVDLSQADIDLLAGARNAEEFEQIAEALGLTSNEIATLLPRWQEYNRLVREQERITAQNNSLFARRAELEREISRTFQDSINALGGISGRASRNIRENLGLDSNASNQEVLQALARLSEEEQDAALEAAGITGENLAVLDASLTTTSSAQITELIRINDAIRTLGETLGLSIEELAQSAGFSINRRDQLEELRRGGLIRGYANGGKIQGFPTGGAVRGPGSGTSDSILARVSNGEYVIRASSVSKYGTRFLDALNNGAVDRAVTGLGPLLGFAAGGQIGRYQGGGAIGGSLGVSIANEIEAALGGSLRPTLEEIAGLSTSQLELLSNEVAEIGRLEALLDEGNLTALQTLAIQEQIEELQGNIASQFARGSEGEDQTNRLTDFTIEAAAEALGGISQLNLAIAATDEQLRRAIDLETQRASILNTLSTGENLTLERRRELVSQLDNLNSELEDLGTVIEQQVPGLRRAREEFDFIAMNLSSDIARSISQGNFNNIGDLVRSSIQRSLQTRIQQNLEENLNVIFDAFANQVFSSLSSSVSGGSGASGGGIGAIFSGIGSFFGGLFHEGGIVPGGPNDNVPIIAQGGEAVLTAEQQRALFRGDRDSGGSNRPAQIVNINVSGNVDQRAIDQIRQVIAASPEQVGGANQNFQSSTQGLRRR